MTTHGPHAPRVFDGQALRHRRQDAGHTIDSLAQATALSANGIRKLETGLRSPRPSTYLRLIRCLRLAEGDLWTYPETSAVPAGSVGGA